MKKWITVLVIAALAGGGFWWWKATSVSANGTASDTMIEKVTRGTLSQSVSCTGKVVSNLDVDIKCKASGEVIKLPKDVSDTVQKGELLVELDPVDEKRAVARAEADLAEAQARLDQAKQNVLVAESDLVCSRDKAKAALLSAEAKAKDTRSKADRRKQLLEQGYGAQEDYDAAEATAIQAEADRRTAMVAVQAIKTQELALEAKRQDVKSFEAQLQSTQIALSDAKQRLANTIVNSPMDGVVAARNIQIGTIISSAVTNVGGGTTVIVLSDLSHVYVLAAVDESDIGQVQKAMEKGEKAPPVIITADAYKGERFHGKIVRIATRGVNSSNVVTFEVKIEVMSDNKAMLKPEMTANVEIVTERRKETLMVPVGAITVKEDQRYVTLPGKDEAPPVDQPVQVGPINDGVNVEIVSGVNEGQEIVVRKGEGDSRWQGNSSRRMSPMMMPRGGRH